MAAVAAAPISLPGPSSHRSQSVTSNRSSTVESKRDPATPVPPVVKVEEDNKSDVKVEKKSPTKETDNTSFPHRPPAKPTSLVRSKFDLEPNPFEQSFRESHGSEEDPNESRTPPRGGDATAIKHNALPPLSSLTSPAAADPSQFPWLANQSLRSGPLSPAMLAGPQNGHSNGHGKHEEGGGGQGGFDTTTFRTGFTPGTGSGFTPGYSSLMGGAGFNTLPLPSPNTAAFLNMVTDSTPIEGDHSQSNADDNQNDQNRASAVPAHMQGLGHIQHHPDMPPQETITPNTLSALTGVVNDMNRSNQQSNGQHGMQHGGPHGHLSGGQNQQQQQQQPNGPPHQYYNQHMPPGYMPSMHVDYAQQSANAASQAANGLFLLSQAHQELAQRDDGQPHPPPPHPSNLPTSAGPNSANPLSRQPGGYPQLQHPLPGPHPQQHGSQPPHPGAQHPQHPQQQHNIPPQPLSASINKKAGTFIQHQIGGTKNGINGAGGGGTKRKSDASESKTGGGGKKKKGESKLKGESTSPAMHGFGGDDDDDGMDDDDGSNDGMGGSGKGETEEDKRKNFLERNRQAALKCRQRKKAWLNELQTKVEQLQMENDRLNQTVAGLHDEVGRLTGILMQHRDCGIGIPQYGRPMR